VGRPDYYAALGVARDADAPALKAAYRRLAARLHPDRNAGQAEVAARFKGVVEAWAVLGDDARRAAYDAALQSGDALAVERASGLAEVVGGLVDGLFGVKEGRPEGGRNRVYRLTVSFADAVLALPQVLRLPTSRPCAACEGRGFPLGGVPELCGRCLGQGSIQGRPFLRSARLACPDCEGRGYALVERCEACAGAGMTAVEERVEIRLPPGCVGGERLRVRGRGEPGRWGGADGDLWVELSVAEHPVLRRDGDDLLLRRPVSVFTAMTGGSVTVPTVDGERAVRLPACSADGTVLRLAGYGARRVDGERGDLRVELAVELPVALGDEARAALARVAAGVAPAAFPRTRSFEEQDDG